MTKVVIRSGLLAIALFGATQASAQLATRANGPVTQNGKANVIAATVVGNHSTAEALQNSVSEGSQIDGAFTQNGKANVIAATVVGNHSQAVAAQNSFGARKITR